MNFNLWAGLNPWESKRQPMSAHKSYIFFYLLEKKIIIIHNY
nr:MAG TPA: hypothetical protein [Caudoviricetes sp.]DAN61828.1 MAG TPA: hypothetical protein [Caudoviricetes sp.]DAQ57006.1 MAG TPA: hypothetical protein [Caudoviricetes sp.]DAU66334.1 MAG TPA: hypothetical protein [Caudoviricetes sp.]